MTPDGAEHPITKTTVGGVVSQGMFCDSSMLGWSGGGKGVAAQLPDSFEIGSSPPSEKPRLDDLANNNSAPPEEEIKYPEVKGLFEKKLTKEEKKKLTEERRRKRREAKAAKKEMDEK